MTADSNRPKMGMTKYGGCIFIPGTAVKLCVDSLCIPPS